MHHFSPHTIYVCAEKHRNNVCAFKTVQPAMHWQHLYIPEVDKKTMATAVVRTRKESHQLAQGDDETTVTSKKEVKYGSNEAWLWEDCAIIPDVLSLGQDVCQKPALCKFIHLHRFMVCFLLHIILVFQIFTELRGNK